MEPQMDSQLPKTKEQSRLHQVTPLSKYLAMVLFIIMPFLGGWIGYVYAPEKVVEVEMVIKATKSPEVVESTGSIVSYPILDSVTDKEFQEFDSNYVKIEEGLSDHISFNYELNFDDTTDWVLYVNQQYGFALRHPPNMKVREDSNNDDYVNFTLEGDLSGAIFTKPSVRVYENIYNHGIVDELALSVGKYTDVVYKTTIDGRPAFWIMSAENGLAIGKVVTKKYIFQLFATGNISFDDTVVGVSEPSVQWPDKVRRNVY